MQYMTMKTVLCNMKSVIGSMEDALRDMSML